MSKIREFALIGVVMIVGILAGAVYAYAFGGQTTLSIKDGMPQSQEETIALENEAAEIALVDPRVKPLVEGKEVRIFSTLYSKIKIVFTNETQEGPGWVKMFKIEWDGIYRALVTIRFPDNTGYWIDVNITDRMIDQLRKAYWEDGKYILGP